MSTNTKPVESGQQTDNPLVALLDKHTRAFVRVTAALTKLSARLDAIERRLDADAAEDIDDDADTNVDGEPLREPGDSNDPVPFAIGIDGRAVLHVSYLELEDVSERPHWIGITLDEGETAMLLAYAEDAAADAAGRMGGFIRKCRKATPDDSGEQGGAP